MREEKREIIKLTSAKFLLTLFNAVELIAKPFFKASSMYRESVKEFEKNNDFDIDEINERIHYLKRMGFIKTFVERKERFVELSRAGHAKMKQLLSEIKIKIPTKWDGKWRVVIFDVPEKSRAFRDSLRFKLLSFGFIKIQKSVYIFPYPCAEEIISLSKSLGIEKNVTVMVAEIILEEEDIIDQFLKSGILNKNDLKTRRFVSDRKQIA